MVNPAALSFLPSEGLAHARKFLSCQIFYAVQLHRINQRRSVGYNILIYNKSWKNSTPWSFNGPHCGPYVSLPPSLAEKIKELRLELIKNRPRTPPKQCRENPFFRRNFHYPKLTQIASEEVCRSNRRGHIASLFRKHFNVNLQSDQETILSAIFDPRDACLLFVKFIGAHRHQTFTEADLALFQCVLPQFILQVQTEHKLFDSWRASPSVKDFLADVPSFQGSPVILSWFFPHFLIHHLRQKTIQARDKTFRWDHFPSLQPREKKQVLRQQLLDEIEAELEEELSIIKMASISVYLDQCNWLSMLYARYHHMYQTGIKVRFPPHRAKKELAELDFLFSGPIHFDHAFLEQTRQLFDFFRR